MAELTGVQGDPVVPSDIYSLTRSSSSSNSGTATMVSPKRTTAVDDSLSKMSTDECLADLKATPSKTPATTKIPRVFHPLHKDISKFLVDSCCSKVPTAVQPPADVAAAPSYVHQRLLSAIRHQPAKEHALVGFKEPGERQLGRATIVDIESNTAQHYAAEFGIVVAVTLLCSSPGSQQEHIVPS
ncbi:hypothetical protein B0T26DRAFT_671549 [Lasiosphaeria miniovina]|uniref:Uncharacterized protein n=1 Tax=Lasiosphaeria miniovina TaxID=1954250 RepID=A0AA40B351_9PEZI|nr:uncharacterized protein B0T26DRAFT_671549 [Lasiosphaeria miniovina]KAK0726796.1 hypothetical protein B0T26DRAFT_671549 [Lasiosphaeria miniovina]